MKDYCLELAASQKSTAAKYNAMREYLQAYVLRIMGDRRVFESAAFVGGTALRFLYDLPRFSEDLDFSLHKKPALAFADLLGAIKRELVLAGYEVEVVYKETRTVQGAFVKFAGLLHEAGLSPLPGQKFSIKIEIDSRPPSGAVLTTRIVNKFFPIAFLSHDLSSLLAGKIHALLSRKYTKGRDYFDLAWYLSRFPAIVPNFKLLHNALRQTGYAKKLPGKDDWREYLSGVVQKADWKTVHKDVVNFLENPGDMNVFTKGNVLKMIQTGR
ncbi:MAG: nucleotidyl transferase AbiEii/AbiGii toxin family protein [Candidatus Omnitrophota bacterium]|nr:nucleotidyl transferase AbiEii/AbiGii toxin family protein [Candidatus Omnitrophota bacterium]